MASKRQKDGFVTGEHQLDTADLQYYEYARRAKDPKTRMYWYNRVLHGKKPDTPNHGEGDVAHKILNEMYQTFTRNNVRTTERELIPASDPRIVGVTKGREHRRKALIQSLSAFAGNLHEMSSERLFRIHAMLECIVKFSKPNHVRYLAFLIIETHMDQLISDWTHIESLESEINELYVAMQKPRFHIHKHMGTRYHAEKTAQELVRIIKSQPLLLNIKLGKLS